MNKTIVESKLTTNNIAQAVTNGYFLSQSLLQRAEDAFKSLIIPAQYDVEKNWIVFWFEEPAKFVKVVVPCDRNNLNPPDTEDKAKALWLEKYSETMPDGSEEYPAEGLGASWLQYDGTRSLSTAEVEIIQSLSDQDLTVDMVWLLVEGLNLTLGTPIPEDDERWLPILWKDDECIGYLSIVRQCLGMTGV